MESISPSDQNQLQAVDNALQQTIQQAQGGGGVNAKNIQSLQEQIKSLMGNPNIPDSVQQSLQAASNELKQVQNGQGDITNLYSAKMQLDAAIESQTSEIGIENIAPPGPQGGSLGGGES